MVRQTSNHIFRCGACYLPLSDEGEEICSTTGYIILNDAINIATLPLVIVASGLEMRPITCTGCNHAVGCRFEKNFVFPPHEGKIVLERQMVAVWTDMAGDFHGLYH